MKIRVWPDGTVQNFEDGEESYNWMSDDYEIKTFDVGDIVYHSCGRICNGKYGSLILDYNNELSVLDNEGALDMLVEGNERELTVVGHIDKNPEMLEIFATDIPIPDRYFAFRGNPLAKTKELNIDEFVWDAPAGFDRGNKTILEEIDKEERNHMEEATQEATQPMRELVIEKYIETVKYLNDNRLSVYQEWVCPDFSKLTNKEILDKFLYLHMGSCQPRG
jgi:hypothetical protein